MKTFFVFATFLCLACSNHYVMGCQSRTANLDVMTECVGDSMVTQVLLDSIEQCNRSPEIPTEPAGCYTYEESMELLTGEPEYCAIENIVAEFLDDDISKFNLTEAFKENDGLPTEVYEALMDKKADWQFCVENLIQMGSEHLCPIEDAQMEDLERVATMVYGYRCFTWFFPDTCFEVYDMMHDEENENDGEDSQDGDEMAGTSDGESGENGEEDEGFGDENDFDEDQFHDEWEGNWDEDGDITSDEASHGNWEDYFDEEDGGGDSTMNEESSEGL